MYMYLRGGSRHFHKGGGGRLFQKPFFFQITKDTETSFKAKIARHSKKINDEDETGNILLKYILPVYNLAQKKGGGGCTPLDSPMYLLGDGHLILRGIWKVFLRNKYSGQAMSKNKINILSRSKQNQIHHK